MTTLPLSTPFTFDTEFDAAGVVVRPSAFRPVKRAFTPNEVEALVAQARLEARTEALAETETLQAMALSTIAQALTDAVPVLTQVAQTHREQAAELALAAARVVASAALERFPAGPLQAALEALGQSPRFGKWTFTTDGGYMSTIKNIVTVGYAPGDENFAQTAYERVGVDALIQAAAGYAAISQRISG